MQVTPEIIFHDVERSQWIEDYVVERLGHLERFSQDITRCHVTLSREQGSQKKGNRYSVMVEVRIPQQHDLAAYRGGFAHIARNRMAHRRWYGI